MQGLLVALDRQKAVATLIADPLDDVCLGVYSVSGDYCPVEVEGFEQDRQGGDLVGPVRHSLLSHRTVPVA